MPFGSKNPSTTEASKGPTDSVGKTRTTNLRRRLEMVDAELGELANSTKGISQFQKDYQRKLKDLIKAADKAEEAYSVGGISKQKQLNPQFKEKLKALKDIGVFAEESAKVYTTIEKSLKKVTSRSLKGGAARNNVLSAFQESIATGLKLLDKDVPRQARSLSKTLATLIESALAQAQPVIFDSQRMGMLKKDPVMVRLERERTKMRSERESREASRLAWSQQNFVLKKGSPIRPGGITSMSPIPTGWPFPIARAGQNYTLQPGRDYYPLGPSDPRYRRFITHGAPYPSTPPRGPSSGYMGPPTYGPPARPSYPVVPYAGPYSAVRKTYPVGMPNPSYGTSMDYWAQRIHANPINYGPPAIPPSPIPRPPSMSGGMSSLAAVGIIGGALEEAHGIYSHLNNAMTLGGLDDTLDILHRSGASTGVGKKALAALVSGGKEGPTLSEYMARYGFKNPSEAYEAFAEGGRTFRPGQAFLQSMQLGMGPLTAGLNIQEWQNLQNRFTALGMNLGPGQLEQTKKLLETSVQLGVEKGFTARQVTDNIGRMLQVAQQSGLVMSQGFATQLAMSGRGSLIPTMRTGSAQASQQVAYKNTMSNIIGNPFDLGLILSESVKRFGTVNPTVPQIEKLFGTKLPTNIEQKLAGIRGGSTPGGRLGAALMWAGTVGFTPMTSKLGALRSSALRREMPGLTKAEADILTAYVTEPSARTATLAGMGWDIKSPDLRRITGTEGGFITVPKGTAPVKTMRKVPSLLPSTSITGPGGTVYDRYGMTTASTLGGFPGEYDMGLSTSRARRAADVDKELEKAYTALSHAGPAVTEFTEAIIQAWRLLNTKILWDWNHFGGGTGMPLPPGFGPPMAPPMPAHKAPSGAP